MKNAFNHNFEKIRKPNRNKDFEYTYKKSREINLRREKKVKYASREKENE